MDLTTTAPSTRISDGRSLFGGGELAVVREVLLTLDTLTTAGQQHTMAKLVGLMQDRSSRVLTAISSRNRDKLAELMAHLQRECSRVLPDVRSFSDRADRVVALLSSAA